MHNRSDTSALLPAGKHFAVTWSVPVVHGGRTNSMLHRSRAFAAEGGAPVEILTFDNFRDYPDIRKTLTGQGKLTDGVTLRNIWEDLVPPWRSTPPFSRRTQSPASVRSVRRERPSPRWKGGPSGGPSDLLPTAPRLLQTDYLREDGTSLPFGPQRY